MLRNLTSITGYAILALFSVMLNTKVFASNVQSEIKAKANADAGSNFNAASDKTKSPLTENFEGETFPPAGWAIYSQLDDTVNWNLNAMQNHTPGGSYSAYHNSTPGENPVDNWLVTPSISIASDGFHYLSFWSFLGNGWSYKKNSVLISTGSPDPADGQYVEKWVGISNDGWIWAHFFINLEEYIGQQIYIAFRYEGDSWGHNWSLDDVAVMNNSPVISISNSEVNQNVAINGTGSKTLEIENQGIQDLIFEIEVEYLNATGWLSINPSSGNVASQTGAELSIGYNAMGLAVGTYQANLNISSNDPGNAETVVQITMKVLDVNVYPFNEDFENEEFLPLGWSKYDMDGDETGFALSYFNNTPEGQFSALHSYGWSPQDGWLVTPQITIPGEGFFYLSFWSMVGDAAYYGKNSVLVSTGSGNPGDGDFVEVWTVAEVTDGWVQYYINLAQYAGLDVYIAFRYEGEFAHYWAIDDISMGEEIDDSPVMNISTTEIIQTSGQDGTSTKTFKVINNGVQNLVFDIEIALDDDGNWLAASPGSGSIPAKSSQTITLTMNANGLVLGAFHSSVFITGNDTLNAIDTLSVTLNVIEPQAVNNTVIYPLYTFPTSISTDGKYVSGSQFGGKNSYMWTRFGNTIDFAGDAQGVSDNGRLVGTYDTGFMFEGSEVSTAGIWNQSTREWEFLGINPAVPDIFGTFYNCAYGVSADGSTIVGMQWYPSYTVRAFKWTETSGYEMIGPSTGYNTRANGISANGTVIFGWAEPNWTRTPVIWYNNEMIFIDETQYGEASGASPSGNFVTGSLGSGGFIWSPGQEVMLISNTLNSGYLSPLTILDDGTLFGYTAEGFPPTPSDRRAFVRYPDGTMTSFNEYVQSRGWFEASDWIFYSVNDVTPDGNKFIGAAMLPSGNTISFMLDLESGNPNIQISQMSMTETLSSGQSSAQPLVIENAGDGYLLYDAVVQYTATDPLIKKVPRGEEYKSGKLILGKTIITGNKGNFAPKGPKGTILNYDGDNFDAIGLVNGGTFYAAARYPSEMVAVYENYKLESVDVFIGNIPTTLKLMIWDAGTTTTTGTLLHEQIFSPAESSWNHIALTNPVDISGSDLWVGFEITHDAGLFVLGLDGGPTVHNGNWISTDFVAWEHMADYGINGNWNIRANLSFNGFDWLNISNSTGILEEAQSVALNIAFNAIGLGLGTYTANLRISSNDAENSLIVIPVTLIVDSTNSVEPIQATELNIFPNPASSTLTLTASQNIIKYTITSVLGQTVYSVPVNGRRVQFDVSNLDGGVYLLQVQTKNEITVHRIQINK